MTKNCPNCGAPIDIHRRSCEYCGTPYERNEEKMALYADNIPLYIYQEPSLLKCINPIELQKMILAEENRRLRNQLDASIMNANMHGFGKIEECCNAFPKISYHESKTESVKDRSMLKATLMSSLVLLPIVGIFILKLLNII